MFISYSHADATLVAPVVQLMRVNRALVFRDTEQITPGKKWRNEIDRGLNDASLVVVFWCEHSCASAEVEVEWKKAIELDKDVLPLLLDATPLPSPLAEYQYIDFRQTVGARHGRSHDEIPTRSPSTVQVPPPLMRASKRWATVGGIAASLMVVTFGIFWLLTMSDSMDGPPPVGGPGPDAAPLTGGRGWWLAGLLLITASWVAWRRLRTLPRAPAEYMPGPHTSVVIEQRIARELEAEIIRRSSLRKATSP